MHIHSFVLRCHPLVGQTEVPPWSEDSWEAVSNQNTNSSVKCSWAHVALAFLLSQWYLILSPEPFACGMFQTGSLENSTFFWVFVPPSQHVGRMLLPLKSGWAHVKFNKRLWRSYNINSWSLYYFQLFMSERLRNYYILHYSRSSLLWN